jgi:hypothetical protein
MADIFVSYTSSDRDWAFWIAKELETASHALERAWPAKRRHSTARFRRSARHRLSMTILLRLQLRC